MSGVRGLLARLAAAFLVFMAAGAHAGGPLGICDDAGGTPLAYSPAVVTLNYDRGNLGARTKLQADALVTNAVALWTNVSTATIAIGRGADLPEDVTSATYLPYFNNFGDGRNPVIYDTDGSIIDSFFGPGQKSSILGFAGSTWFNEPSCRYVEGRAVINGFINVADVEMGLTLAHEIGHLIGLDHTQLDSVQGLVEGSYPLMYPFVARNALTLHEDDMAAVSALYPDASLNSVYGEVSGAFVLANGVTPVRGANLWATETTTNKVYSIVTDYRMQNTGFFKLLLPPGSYNLRAEAIFSSFSGGSGVGPYSADPADPASLSFQPPLYQPALSAGGSPMPTLTLGNGSPLAITITAGCAASVTFRLDGIGSVTACPLPPPPPPPPLFRAYLKSTGNDANPCTLTAPCRLLPAALAAVAGGGEIWMLNSANYNTAPVAITKSVTILAVPAAVGSVVALGGNALNITTVGVKVALRNLVIVPFVGGGGTGGINMTAGASLTVEDCLIANLPGNGISVSNGVSVRVTDTAIRNNGNAGIWIQNGARATVTRATISGNSGSGLLVHGTAPGITTADIADSTINANASGVFAHSTTASAAVRVSVFDSVAVGNANAGVIAQSDAGGAVTLSASRSLVSNNGTGIVATGTGSRVWASGNTVGNNSLGLQNSSAIFESASDNAVRNNSSPTLGPISPVPGM